jgi:PAS domain S-box-containing protein
VVSGIRAGVGAGVPLRSLVRPLAWVWLVDLLLIPVGVFAAVVAARAPVGVLGVLPLAALLAVFARERTGRIENAMELQRLAQEGQDRLQSIVQNSSDLIAILEPDASVRTLTGAVEGIFGPAWEAAQGESLLERVHPDDRAPVSAFLTVVAGKSVGESQEAEWRMRYADGSHRHIAAVATNLVGDPHVGGMVITARDVNDRKAFEEQLRHRAFHDALTGLANRALFYDRIEHTLAGATRDDAQLAVLFVDLDDFKAVNDARGHAEGDRLLELVAARLTSCLRSGDTAARLGGDEFGILLQGVASADGVRADGGAGPGRPRAAVRAGGPARHDVGERRDGDQRERRSWRRGAAAARGPGDVRGEAQRQAAGRAVSRGSRGNRCRGAGARGVVRPQRRDPRGDPRRARTRGR